jgi:hypothetical protein
MFSFSLCAIITQGTSALRLFERCKTSAFSFSPCEIFSLEHRLCTSLCDIEIVRSLFRCVQLLHKVHQLCASLRDAKLVRSSQNNSNFISLDSRDHNSYLVSLCMKIAWLREKRKIYQSAHSVFTQRTLLIYIQDKSSIRIYSHMNGGFHSVS